jgi:hypothetical protein
MVELGRKPSLVDESRSLASGKSVTQFSLATNVYAGGKERAEYHSVVTWD